MASALEPRMLVWGRLHAGRSAAPFDGAGAWLVAFAHRPDVAASLLQLAGSLTVAPRDLAVLRAPAPSSEGRRFTRAAPYRCLHHSRARRTFFRTRKPADALPCCRPRSPILGDTNVDAGLTHCFLTSRLKLRTVHLQHIHSTGRLISAWPPPSLSTSLLLPLGPAYRQPLCLRVGECTVGTALLLTELP